MITNGNFVLSGNNKNQFREILYCHHTLDDSVMEVNRSKNQGIGKAVDSGLGHLSVVRYNISSLSNFWAPKIIVMCIYIIH